MNILNKYPKGIWEDKNGIPRYPDGMVYNKEVESKGNELADNPTINEEHKKPVNTKAEAIKRIYQLSNNLINSKNSENLKLAHAEEIKKIIQKFNLTETEINIVLGKGNWVNFKEGKGLNFLPGGLH